MNSDKDNIRRYWVAPFGDSRIKSCSHFPGTYRRVPRPSSPLIAKASTRCPFLSWFSMRMWNLKNHIHTIGLLLADDTQSFSLNSLCLLNIRIKNILLYSRCKYFIKTLYTDYSSIYSLHFLFTLSNNTLYYFNKEGWKRFLRPRAEPLLVEARRFELLTYALQTHCSTSWAMPPPFVKVVGLGGLGPPTSRLSGVRSNHLSYKPFAVACLATRQKQMQGQLRIMWNL